MQWISVKNQFPPLKTELLTYDEDGVICVEEFTDIDQEADTRLIFSDGGGWISHWMHLPDKPKD